MRACPIAMFIGQCLLVIEEAVDLHPERNSKNRCSIVGLFFDVNLNANINFFFLKKPRTCILEKLHKKTDVVSLAVFTLTLTLTRLIGSTTLLWKVTWYRQR